MKKPKHRGSLRTESRSNIWYTSVFLPNCLSNDEFKENFRLSKKTFKIICDELRPYMSAKFNKLNRMWKRRQELTIEKKVAVALYYLASCAEYRVIGNQFGIHKTTVCKVIHNFLEMMSKYITPKVIKFPDEISAVEYASLFKARSQLPNIIGAIDGTHIAILPPEEGYRDFVNRKGWPSVILQAVVGPKYQFIDISIKQPGSSHDAAALLSSSLYKNVDNIMPKVWQNLWFQIFL